MLYALHEFQYAMTTPLRLWAEAVQLGGGKGFEDTPLGRPLNAFAELTHRLTKRYTRPVFGHTETVIAGKSYKVKEEIILDKPFCRLLHFKKLRYKGKQPKILLCSPLAGHFATLLRGTVEALLPHHDVYITDWCNARNIPLTKGTFDFEDCVDYILEFIRTLSPNIHVVAVCQPSVPVFVAASLLAQMGDKAQPKSITLMGGPIDTRVNPTEVNLYAKERPIEWFQNTVIARVPVYYPGAMRNVYPGFVQLTGFMQLNLGRHIDSHLKLYDHLVKGDGESAEFHRKFYDEYLAVMDLPAEFYLQTVENVFQEHKLPRGLLKHRGLTVNPKAIKKTALLTVEGERDDISAPGQTKAAHKLVTGLAKAKQKHHLQKSAGHYGIFNGRRWREEVRPVITKFINKHS